MTFNDWGLLAYSDNKGGIRVKDIANKFTATNMDKHTKAVYGLDFAQGSSSLVSGGDDLHINVFDFSTSQVVHTYKRPHSDFIRRVKFFPGNSNMFLSSSFDKTSKIFDIRESEPVRQTFAHGAEIEDSCIFKNGTQFAVVGGLHVAPS